MKITNYSKQVHNANRFNVDVDGQYLFAISINGWIKYGLYVGKEITTEDIENWVKDDNKEVAFNRLLNILDRGLKTEKELRVKLSQKKDSKGRERSVIFSEEEIDYAIEKAKSYGYVNDEYYTMCYIKERAIPNKWGKQKLTTALYQKGISKELIKDGIEKYFKEDIEEDSAYDIALKKYKTIYEKYDKRTCVNKIYTYLRGRGFSYDIIKSIMEKLSNESFED